MAATLVLVAATVAVATENVVAGLVSAPLLATGFQYVTGHSLFNLQTTSLLTVALTGVKRKYQQPQLGGSKRLYLVFTEDLESEFMTYELALSAGKYAAAIPLKASKKFIEIEAWYDTTKWDGEMKPGAGFTQGIEFEVLGYAAEVVKLQAQLYELPVNVIVQGNDGDLYYLGQKYVPLMFEAVAQSPVKGTDRKKVTFRAKNDGYTCPVMPLDATATFAVEALV